MSTFPVLFGQTKEYSECRRTGTPYPQYVPWDLVKDHEEQAQRTHSQTLSRLAERGGLSPLELWCVVHDVSFWKKGDMTEAKAIEWLRTIEGVIWQVPRHW